MPRVSQESLEKLKAFVDSLPTEAMGKCALCVDTLTHLTKTAEVETGAPTATVTRVFAEKINEDAAPGDRVSGEALRQRTLENSGEKKRICSNGTNKPQHNPLARKEELEGAKNQCTEAYQFETIAISQLRRIRKDDPDRVGALTRVKKWIESQLLKG